MPDQGPAPWVSANDKPVAPAGSKPVTGDAAERRLKGDVMQLPARDRRRIKELAQNDVGFL
jgi:transcriptional coactivator HFI1/ADA1